MALDSPRLFDRPGNPYLGPDGRDWPDNHLRFGALCRVAARIATDGVDGWQPDVVHLHDWQAGLAAAYLALARRPAPPTLLTIHNIAFQGIFPAEVTTPLGLPRRGFHPGGFEFFGQVGFLKAGLVYARPNLDGQSDLCPRAHAPRVRHGTRRGHRFAPRRVARHSQRHRPRGLEPGERPAHRSALLRPGAGRQGREPRRPGPPIRARRGRQRPPVLRRQPSSPGRRGSICCSRSCPG